jgi:hypothetical protein
VYAVATTNVFDPIPSDNLPDAGPQRDLKTCNVRELVAVSDTGLDAIRSRYRILLAKYLFEHFPEFRVLQCHIPSTTDCMYSEQTCLKSEVITMPIWRIRKSIQNVLMSLTNLRHGHTIFMLLQECVICHPNILMILLTSLQHLQLDTIQGQIN